MIVGRHVRGSKGKSRWSVGQSSLGVAELITGQEALACPRISTREG